MIDQIKRYELETGINLHLIKSNKFKTVLFGVYIKRPLNRQEAALNALLSRIMDKATAKNPTQLEMSRALDYLYGAVLISDVHKYGEKQVIQIKLQIPNEKYVNDATVTDQALGLLNDILENPLVEGDCFNPQVFKTEQARLIEEVEMRRDDKDSWAMSLCIETMCKDELYGIHEYGTVEEISAITPEALYAHYKMLMESSEMDIVAIGNFEFEALKQKIESNLHFSSGPKTQMPVESVIHHPKEVQYIEESHEINQGKLVMGYRLNVPYTSDAYLPAFIGSVILGYGGSSKLFKVVREREGLCYSIFARTDKFKSILLVYAGVDFENFDKAEVLIREQVEAIRAGILLDKELEIAKEALISSYQSVSDYQNSFINFYYNQYLSSDVVDLEDHIKRIMAVTKNDIIKAFSNIELDTITHLKGED